MATETLRPNGAGSFTEYGTASPPNWQNVDESVADDATTTNYHTTNYTTKKESYALSNSGVGAGTINSIKVVLRMAHNGVSGNTVEPSVVISGTMYYGTSQSVTTQYPTFANYEHTFSKNPATSNDWSWSDINALEVGLRSYRNISANWITQAYIVIDYTPASGWSNVSKFIGTAQADLSKGNGTAKAEIGKVSGVSV